MPDSPTLAAKVAQMRPLRWVSRIENHLPVVMDRHEITRDMFLMSCIQYVAWPDKTKVRLLQCREPDNSLPKSTTYTPGLVEDRYLLMPEHIDRTGSVSGFDLGSSHRSKGMASQLNGLIRTRAVTPESWQGSSSTLGIYCSWLRDKLQDVVMKTPSISPRDANLVLSFRTYNTFCPIAGRVHQRNNQCYNITIASCDTVTAVWDVRRRLKVYVRCMDEVCKRSTHTIDLSHTEVPDSVRNALLADLQKQVEHDTIAVRDIFASLLSNDIAARVD
jgi:hypothetical protein